MKPLSFQSFLTALFITIFIPMLAWAHEDSPKATATVLNRGIEDAYTEEEKLSILIQATETTLEKLRLLKLALEAFRIQEKRCIEQNDVGSDALFKLSKKAYTLLNLIQETETKPYFRKNFLDELGTISKAYKAKALPSPKLESSP